MSTALDSALALTDAAGAATLIANTTFTSQAHFQAQQAHQMAHNAWDATGIPNTQAALHFTQQTTHSNSAVQLKSAGK